MRELKSDAPAGVGDDAFGRKAFVDSLSSMVRNAPTERSFIIALNGSWGSGKTTLLHLLKAELDGGDEVAVVEFNPWLCSSPERLLVEFFECLGAELKGVAEKKKSSTRMAALAKVADGVSRFARAAALVNPGALLMAGGAEALKHLAETGVRNRAELDAQRRQIADALRSSKTRVLVMVDDVDRLHGSEIFELVRLLRLVADFPQMIVLAAFDRERVVKALVEPSYLEKIVQVSIDVPTFAPSVVAHYVETEIDKLIPQGWPDHRQFVRLVIAPVVTSLRTANRLLNALQHILGLLGSEVEPRDLIAVEALRVLAPDAATLGNLDFLRTNDGKAGDRSKHLVQLGFAERPHAAIVDSLFPPYGNLYRTTTEEAGRNGRLANEAYFNAYALKALPANLSPRRNVLQWVDRLPGGDILDELSAAQVLQLKWFVPTMPVSSLWRSFEAVVWRNAREPDGLLADARGHLAGDLIQRAVNEKVWPFASAPTKGRDLYVHVCALKLRAERFTSNVPADFYGGLDRATIESLRLPAWDEAQAIALKAADAELAPHGVPGSL